MPSDETNLDFHCLRIPAYRFGPLSTRQQNVIQMVFHYYYYFGYYVGAVRSLANAYGAHTKRPVGRFFMPPWFR